MNIEELKKQTNYAHKFMQPNKEEDASVRWHNKKVTNQKVLFDGTNNANLTYKEGQDSGFTNECYKTGSSSFYMKGNTYAEGYAGRPTLSVTLNFDNLDLSKYNRITFNIMPVAVGYYNFYSHYSICSNGVWTSDAPSINPNEWNEVIWEIDKVERSNVKLIKIDVFMMGCPPEATEDVSVYLDSITVENVDADYDLGWDLENRIAYSHAGYYPNLEKVAVTGHINEKEFNIFENDQKVFTGNVLNIESELGKFAVLDFTSFQKPGTYVLKVGNRSTKEFIIDEKPFDEAIWKSMNFLRLLRCGEDISGVHSECHLNCRCFDEEGKSLPVFGGWHDAGDVSQFEICTSEMAHAILDLAESVKNKDYDLYDRLMEEARVGVNWTLRTRFGDGYRALTVLYNVWRPNCITKDNDTAWKNKAENGPFENFIAAACEAKAAICFAEEDPIYASWCKRSAEEDFKFAYDGYKNGIYTKRWGPSIDAQTAGHGCLAACELYDLTKDVKYLDAAKEYAKVILSCQETIGLGDIGLKGFFYEDPLHNYVLTYEHRGHENSPVQGLAKLMEVSPFDTDYKLWENGLKLYAEYIYKTIDDTKPYGLLPGHVYILGKVNFDRITIPASYGTREENIPKLIEQIKNGKKICEDVYVRKMPIAIQRRGFHATLLAKTKAVSVCAKLLNDNKLKQIVIDQLEWIFGKNPFASSTMYGLGYNYHPLYVAFSPQLVGALPVGIMTKGEADAPYWPMATQAVYKEIWGHTTGKFLWILADLYE